MTLQRRRQLLLGAGAALCAPLPAFAQSKTYRVGILRPTSAPTSADPLSPKALLPAALAKLGLVEGRNLVLDARYAEGRLDRLDGLARDLAATAPDLIVAVAPGAVKAVMKATARTPIVMFGNFDPVASGFVAHLARPGGNVTGVLIAPDGTLAAKKMELLKAAVPAARRVAVLAPEDPSSLRSQLPDLRKAAAALKLELPVVQIKGNDYPEAFARVSREKPDALFLLATTYFVRERRPIIALANQHRLPSIWEWREQVEDGGLLSYGSSLAERYSRLAEYVARILKGARPQDMPVDQPTTFELAINLKTAGAIGLTVPQGLLLRADRVIQ